MRGNVAGFARLACLTIVVLALSSCGDPPSQSTTTQIPIAPSVSTPDQPSATATAPPAKSDGNLESNLANSVKRALGADKDMAGQGIDVTASKGTVTLWGTVGTNDERDRARLIASRVPGVVSVENRLVVVKGS